MATEGDFQRVLLGYFEGTAFKGKRDSDALYSVGRHYGVEALINMVHRIRDELGLHTMERDEILELKLDGYAEEIPKGPWTMGDVFKNPFGGDR